VRLSQRTAITESEYQERLTDYKLAVTRLDLAKENLSETTLAFSLDELDKTDPGAPDDTGTDAATESRSGAATEPAPRPATGDRRRFVIARREISPGESVSAHQVVMEVLQVDHVLLVVGVPESRVRPLIARMREVRATRPGDDAPSRPEPGELKEPDAERFEVHVELLSSGQLGDGGQILDGEVYRIAEAADTTSGLFEVEVLLDNADGMLRPGLIARATIVVDRVRGYDLPISAAVFSNDEASLFTVTSEEVDVKLMHWTLGRRRVDRAQRIDLGKRWARPGGRLVAQWIEQDGRIVIPLPEKPLGRIVTRGQHRVTDGIRVQIVEQDGEIGRVPPEQPALKVGDGLARPRSR
jgi:multidrug efflux pump subunit AcrA (membrane-fusion protein)